MENLHCQNELYRLLIHKNDSDIIGTGHKYDVFNVE